jgi:hypothetical protein
MDDPLEQGGHKLELAARNHEWLLPIQVRNKTYNYREIIARTGIDVYPMPAGVLSITNKSVVVLVSRQPSTKTPAFL